MSKSFPTPSKTFFILFFLHLFLSLVLRLTGQLEQRIFNEILIYGALAYSMIGSQLNYDPSYLKTSSVLFLLYLLSIYTLQDFSNNGLSASEAIEWGTTLFAFFSSWGLLSNSIKQPLLRVCCRAIYYGGLWLTASVPLLGIGYGIVSGGHALSADLILAVFQTNPGEALSYLKEQPLFLWALSLLGIFASGGHALSADLILAVFQTNPGEALSYLKEQPLFLWALSLLGIFAISILVISLSRKMLKAAPVQKPSIILILMALLALNMKSTLPRIKIFYLANTITSARTSLKAYEQYKIMKEIRLNRLSALPPLSIDSQARGTYVLVIGESASRDHMHVYGYDRQTTPWMDKMAGCKGTTIFSYPYANYCQTILSLTYALSEKNQYNHIPLEEAYSIIDLAKAAGYDTYWISNQAGFSASDTPITIISSTAAHHTWINGRGASPSDSTYLDGKLITELPDNVDRPSFIVIHLMGSHSRYADRYPKSYSLFSGRGKFVDGYDNSVRYVDSVLQGIFEKVHNYSNFQGFLYLPDHGEDPESGNAHSPDKFTFQMVRIPFLVYLSPKAIVNRPEIQKELQKHKDLPWTNDLAYNLLISLLGIQNAPYEERQFDLASPTYQLNWEKVKTQHGTKSLSEKIDPHSRFK